jgi:hypothetical protein
MRPVTPNQTGNISVRKVPGAERRMEIAQRASQAGVYEYLGESFSVDEIIDPSLVKQIRAFVPQYVPLVTRRRYRSPAGTEVVELYHVVGRYIEDPREGAQPVRLERVPPGFPFPKDKIHPLRTLWAPWRGPRIDEETGERLPPDPEWVNNTPPARVKPGQWLVDTMRKVQKAFEMQIVLKTGEDGELRETDEGRRDWLVDKLREIETAEERKDARLAEEAMAEARYRLRHNWRQLKAAADKEAWLPEPPDDRPKPFVDLGGRR